MKQEIYMKVTDDKYELPIAWGDTAAELAGQLGLKSTRDVKAKCKKGKYCFRYLKINIRKEV